MAYILYRNLGASFEDNNTGIRLPYTYKNLDIKIELSEAALNKGHDETIFLFADSILSINCLNESDPGSIEAFWRN
jgi:sulfur relay (sulfurtransferase) complex TusBCD TusD component (DsrE family)